MRKSATEIQGFIDELRGGEKPVPCFHWEIEFPEVFLTGAKGFDAIVGNPPFVGGKRISTSYGRAFADWLTANNEDATQNADIVAFFFRRAFGLLVDRGTQGLIATKTIAEGDTRATGLRWLRQRGSELTPRAHRYAICLADMNEQKARSSWPELIDILETKVKPVRATLGDSPADVAHKERWWIFCQ